MVSVNQTVAAPGRYRLLGHPADLAGHIASLGPLPLPPSPGPQWQEAFGGALEASGLTGRGGAGFPAAIKLAMTRAAGRGGTVLVQRDGGRAGQRQGQTPLDSLAPRGARRRTAPGRCHRSLAGHRLRARRDASRSLLRPPTPGRAVGCGLGTRARAAGASARPLRCRRGVGAGAVGRIGSVPPVVPSGQGDALAPRARAALIHNAETLAHVGMIARYGAEAFRRHGPIDDPGTSLITISGAVEHPGVVEVARGTALLDIAARARPFGPPGAFLVGGYGGSWVGPAHFSTPYASLPLRAVGASAGVGVLIVLGSEACGLMETARVARYLAGQSSGQCGPCVYGLPAIADDMARLASRQGRRRAPGARCTGVSMPCTAGAPAAILTAR